MLAKLKQRISKSIDFLSHDIWRITLPESTASKMGLYNIVKSFLLAIRNINGSQLNTLASALTYSTLLSIVPFLAVLFAIARGFGFQSIVESQLFQSFSGQEEVLLKAIAFIDKSIEYAQGGIFLGIGVVLLLYAVVNLLDGIEKNFNALWHIKKGRTYYRMFTDYLALVIITPIFLVCNAGLMLLLNSSASNELIGIVISPFIALIPFIINILLFTFLYSYIPNTKVNFKSALLAGTFTGICFQLFQMLYIAGQVWISKYNAIYGSFAALPLLLLWLQVTWFIILFGVQISFSHQNVKKFDFEHETNNISRRYKDFIILLITTLIVKRFHKGDSPYTADELSQKHKIPTQITSDTLSFLQDIGILLETPSHDVRELAYIPAIDINQISISYLFEKVYLFGSEDFKIDIQTEFEPEWIKIEEMHHLMSQKSFDRLLKDL